MTQCTGGAAPSTLTVTNQPVATVEGMLVATLSDCVAPDLGTFGACAMLQGAPCVPAAVGTWAPGSLIRTLNGLPVLLNTDVLPCGHGGVISETVANNVVDSST